MLDFNQAYNPPCAFTPFATCPLPPPENRLDLAIDAGEKTYHFDEPKRHESMTCSVKSARLSLLAVALLAAPLSVPGAAPGAAPAPGRRTASRRVAKAPPVPLLWKVSDADNAVYLLGSFHLLKRDDYPVSKDVDTAFAAADKLVFEVPPAEMTDPPLGMKMLLHRRLQRRPHAQPGAAGRRARQVQRDAGAARRIDRAVRRVRAVVRQPVAGDRVSQSMGFRAEHGLDQHLMRRAANANKPTSGLETIDLQLQVLDARRWKSRSRRCRSSSTIRRRCRACSTTCTAPGAKATSPSSTS